jgi:hypothetical protein
MHCAAQLLLMHGPTDDKNVWAPEMLFSTQVWIDDVQLAAHW